MALESLSPTNHVSPDGGGNAFLNSHTNTSCNGGVIGLAGEPSNNPTFRAFAFVDTHRPRISTIDLKFTYSLTLSGLTGSVNADIEYSLNNGSSWTSLVSKNNSSQSTTNITQSISTAQDLTQVQVRAYMSGGGPSTGNERQYTLNLTSIRLEVVFFGVTGAGGGMM